MTFLQPFILWGLPLILLPVLIHFLNRMRHRPQYWAAMRFLIAATRSSVSNTKLKQFLILLFRVLAVAMLIFFIARPLAGGWLGWALSPAPDAIVILLDRSASMEGKANGATKREQALKLLADAAKQYQDTSHLVLIDSATRNAQEIAKAANLTDLSLTQPTDTAADIPAMLRSAFNWLIENRAGTAEIWIASDLQKTDWHPDDARWKNVVSQLTSLSQKVRIRLLSVAEAPGNDTAIALNEVTRRQRGDKSELQFVLDLQQSRAREQAGSKQTLPVSITLDGARSQSEIAIEGQSLRWRHRIDLGNRTNGGWGSFEIPADANPRNNTAYFVYGPEIVARAAVIASDEEAARVLPFAASQNGKPAQALTADNLASLDLSKDSLLVWQQPLPTGPTADTLRTFVQDGGVVVFLPPGQPDSQQFNGLGWGTVESAEADKNFRIAHWDEDQGPLAKTDERASLPLGQTAVQKRQLITGQKNAVAAFEDGAAFLVRQSLGKGEVYFCATLPNYNWSSLADGPVLVPMLQRLVQTGSRHLQQASIISCGELSASDQGKKWDNVDSTQHKDIFTQAGVYRAGDRFLAVNRPASEDEPEVLDTEQAHKLFGDLPFQTMQDRRSPLSKLQGEIWRVFLVIMLLFLIGEGILILPARKVGRPAPSGLRARRLRASENSRRSHEQPLNRRASFGPAHRPRHLARFGVALLHKLASQPKPKRLRKTRSASTAVDHTSRVHTVAS